MTVVSADLFPSPPLPSVLTRHLLILSVLPLYSLRPPQELIPYTVWQAIKDGGHSHTYMGTKDMQLTCRAVTRWAPNHFESVIQSAVHTNLSLWPHPNCISMAVSATYTFAFSCLRDSPFITHLISLIMLLTHLCLLSLRSQLKELAVAVWATNVKAAGTGLHLDQSSPLKSAATVPDCIK